MFEIFNPCEDKAFAENSENSTLELKLINVKCSQQLEANKCERSHIFANSLPFTIRRGHFWTKMMPPACERGHFRIKVMPSAVERRHFFKKMESSACEKTIYFAQMPPFNCESKEIYFTCFQIFNVIPKPVSWFGNIVLLIQFVPQRELIELSSS